ncbi:hypothetical protein MHU86_8719 [Fragilaria crotonensis]|nr:hypothetical protein MHU86_8719 [Fragilaria crotonensis]
MKNRLVTVAKAVAACLCCLISAVFLDSSDRCRGKAGSAKLSYDEKMQIIKSVAVLESESIDWVLLRERYNEYSSSTVMRTIDRGTGTRRRLQSNDDFLSQKGSFVSRLLSLSRDAGDGVRDQLGPRSLDNLEESPTLVSQSLSVTFGARNVSRIIDNDNITVEINDLNVMVFMQNLTVTATLDATVVSSPLNDMNRIEALPGDNLRVASMRNQENATISLGSLNASAIIGGENVTVNINGLNLTISRDGQNLTASIDDQDAVVTVGNVSATLKDTVQTNDDALGLDDDALPSVSVTTSPEPSIAPGGTTVSLSPSTTPSTELTDGGIRTTEPSDMLISSSASPSMDINTSISPSPSVAPAGTGVPSTTPATGSMSVSPSPSVEPTGVGVATKTPTPTRDPTTADEPTSSPSSRTRTPQSPTKKPTKRSPKPTIVSTQSPTKKPGVKTPKPIGKPTRAPVPTSRNPNAGGVVIPTYTYDRGNCPKKGSTGLPCAPNNLAQLCSKYDSKNLGRFSTCLKACEPSFCCIHDAPEETNSIAPTCVEDENCAQYAPCYIVWWKIHDTIGPAAYLHLSQNDDFFDVDKLQDVTTDRNFYAQWAYHHWDNINDLLDNILDDEDGLQNLFANPFIWDG